MIFFLNYDGTLTRQDTGRIYQGSTAVPEIKVLSGVSSASSVLEVAFTLPNGLVTQYFPLTQKGEYEQDGIKAFLWSLELATGILANVTEQVGKVGVSVRQVNVINNTVVASYTATFDVEYSALPYTPTEYTPADTQALIDLLGAYYNQNQVLIDSIKGDYDSVVGRLDEQGEDIDRLAEEVENLNSRIGVPLLTNITTDVETGVGTKYYNDGTTATFEFATNIEIIKRDNFMTELTFTAQSNWTQESDGTYSLVFSAETVNRTNANCIVAVDRLDGNGYNQTANAVLKGSDGSLALYGVATPFDGKLLVLAGGGAGTKIWHGTDNLDGNVDSGTLVGTPFAVGDYVDKIYFDTSKKIPMSFFENLEYNEGLAYPLVGQRQYILVVANLNEMGMSGYYIANGDANFLYTTEDFSELAGMPIPVGWNSNLITDGVFNVPEPDTITEISQQDAWSGFISKEPFTSGGGGATGAGTIFETGQTYETIYFNTSVTPDLTALELTKDGYSPLIAEREEGDIGLMYYDMSVLTAGEINGYALLWIPPVGEPVPVYSTETFELDGIVAQEGWNVDRVAYGGVVGYIDQQDKWSPYISSTPFATASADGFVVGQTVDNVYLNINEEIPVDVFEGLTGWVDGIIAPVKCDGDCWIQVINLSLATGGALSGYGLMMTDLANDEYGKFAYSTTDFDLDGISATEGWQSWVVEKGGVIPYGGNAVYEVSNEQNVLLPYVSPKPFESEEGGEDKFEDVLTGDYYLNTDSGKLYVCTGRTDGEVDWEYLLTLKATLKINGVETQNASIFAPTTTREANTNNSCFVLVPNGDNAPEWEQLTVETADNLTYTIKIGGKVAGSFELTTEIYLDSVTYNADTNKLTFTYNTASGKTSFDVDLSDLAGGNVALPSTGTTTISSSSFSITPTGWIATAYVANYTAGTSILISPFTISDYNTCQKIGVYYASKATGDANTIQFYAKNQPNTGVNETITFAYTLIPANSATQAGAVVFDGATGVAKTTNITVTSTAWVQDDNGDYYWGNYCERVDLNIFKPANASSQETLISCGASGMYELPNTAGSTSSKMVIKVKTPPTTDITINKVTFNIGHPNTAMPCAILNLPTASGSGGGASAKTGQVTVEASDWVADDAFGAYRAIITLPTQMDYADTVLLSRTTVNDPHITFAGKWSTDTPTVRISALKAERVTFTWTIIPASATGATQGAVIVSATSQDEILKVDWATLKDMRDNGKLAQGKQYRITDYVATTTQDNTQSAGHPFDIIVVADSPNTLNENARAVAHEGDTYFANCKLSAWEIKYCLDNDKTRFWWASNGGYWIKTDLSSVKVYIFDQKITIGGQEYYRTTVSHIFAGVREPKTTQEVYYYNGDTVISFEEDGDSIEDYGADEVGKGVIYYMKDEYGNECPYDFKNIQFKRWQTEDDESIVYSGWDDTGNDFRWCYTFMAYNLDTMEFYGDASILPHKNFGSDEGASNCLGNIIKPYECEYETSEEDDSQHGRLFLNNIVLYGFNYGEAVDTEEFDYNPNYMPRCNTFGYQCYLMTIGHKAGILSRDNTFGNNCYKNFLSGANNTFGDACQYNRVLVNSCTFYTGVGGRTIEDWQTEKEFVTSYYELVKGDGTGGWQTGYVNAGRTALLEKGWYEIDYQEGGRTYLYNEITRGESPPFFVQSTNGVFLRYFYVNSSSYLCARDVYLTDGSYAPSPQSSVRYRQISNE